MKYFHWNDFDNAIINISDEIKNLNFDGIYGIPRGGLCLAVALSHRLEKPLLNQPKENSLIIDDVCESGKTLKEFKKLRGIIIYVWISKIEPDGWFALEVTQSKEWIVMPWEAKNKAIKDQRTYLNKINRNQLTSNN